MKIGLTSVFVDDQDKALAFYTEVLGFVKKRDIPLGEARWLTIVSPEAPDGTELLLEPNSNPVAKTYQQGIFEQKIPAAVFFVDDVRREHERMTALEVVFTTPPTTTEWGTLAVFEDTCGNLIQLHQA